VETFGRYELIAELGQGGMAQVFLAQLGRGPLARLLAIKRLLKRYSNNQVVIERLAAEARLTVWLSHPNIVQVFDFGRVEDHYYIAMEYVDGCDLRALMWPRDRPSVQLPIPVALEIGCRVLDALGHAHACVDAAGRPLGVIHRDVSPHNVLISRDGHPKLADFGLARAVTFSRHKTHPHALLGKLRYMPPEQAQGNEYDARVDLYAAGVMIYEMITGQKAFVHHTTREDVGERLPPPASTIRPEVPATLDALMARAMAPRPENRFASAQAMAEALAHELVDAGGSPPPEILAGLVQGAVQARESSLERVSLEGYVPYADSLIGEAVTQVKRQRSLVAPPPVAPPPDPSPSSPSSSPPAHPPDPWESLARLKTQPKVSITLPETKLPGSPALAPLPAAAEGAWSLSPAAPTAHAARPTRRLVVLGGGAVLVFLLGLLVGRWSGPTSTSNAPQPVRGAPTLRNGPAGLALASDARPAPAAQPARPVSRSPGRAVITGEREERRDRKPRAGPSRTASGGRLSDAAWDRLVVTLRAAQNAYVGGDYQRAIALARDALDEVPASYTAWQIIVASHCAQGNRKEALLAYARIEGARRNLARQVCARSNIALPAGAP
jgi:serine/threonine-protein kinase